MTSIPYSRFWQPLQFEAGWITIGGNKSAPKGQKGGVPVKVKDGRIVAGPAALQDRQIGNLKEKPEHKADDTPVLARMKGHSKHKQYDPESEQGKSEAARKRRASEGRNETRRANEHAHAARRRIARKQGLNPNQVESAYRELKKHDAEHVAMHNKLIRTAYNALSLTSRSKMLAGEDWASIPGADQVARELANSEDFQFLLKPHGDDDDAPEKLYELMSEGLRQPKDDNALWEEAIDVATKHKPAGKTRAEIDATPFAKFWPMQFAFDEAKHPRDDDGKFIDKSGDSGKTVEANGGGTPKASKQKPVVKEQVMSGKQDTKSIALKAKAAMKAARITARLGLGTPTDKAVGRKVFLVYGADIDKANKFLKKNFPTLDCYVLPDPDEGLISSAADR